MYNLRYHIASLVGVFLALALGLILGGLVVQRGTMDKQQDTLVEGLQREFDALRTQNEALEVQNETLSEFSALLSDEWVVDRLVGKNFIVLAGTGRSDGVQDVVDSIIAGGGTPVTVTLVDPGLAADSDAVSKLFESVESAEVTQSIVASLAAEWTGPTTDRPVTDALVAEGAIKVEGLEPGMATVGLVNLASAAGGSDPTALAIGIAYVGDETVAIGAESPTYSTGVAADFARRGLSGVDTVGTGVGRYSLVALLSGAEPGHYGLAEDAVAAFPAAPED